MDGCRIGGGGGSGSGGGGGGFDLNDVGMHNGFDAIPILNDGFGDKVLGISL